MCLFIFTGIVCFLRNRAADKYLKIASMSIVVLFVMVYAFSPFYGKSYHETGYVYYRHWCYILPVLVLIMINGFVHTGKLKWYMAGAWLIICGIASLQYIGSAKKNDEPLYRPAGWILARKYRNDPGKLFRIHAMVDTSYGRELLVGFGWGLSAAICRNEAGHAAVEKLVIIIRSSPVNDQPAMIEGVYYSFSKGITPVLDQRLLAELKFRFSENDPPNK
jgi:hypothetical protein